MGENMYSYKRLQSRENSNSCGACRFYASLSFCCSDKEARLFLHEVKEELTSATHHAYAYRLGLGDALIARCDDAGEPAGTAGPPMLAVLEKADITNVIVVGTRYFGGVKLGVGGRVRAYRSCAEAGVQAARIYTRKLKAKVLLQVPYDYLGAVVREVEASSGETLDFQYDNDVCLEILIPLSTMDKFPDVLLQQAEEKQKSWK